MLMRADKKRARGREGERGGERERERGSSHLFWSNFDFARARVTVARWSELRVPVLMTFYRRYWKRALSRGRLTRNTFSFSLTHLLTYTHTQTRVHLHAKLLCSSCTSLPDSLGVNIMPPSLVQACMWCFYLLGDVYSFLCVCARACAWECVHARCVFVCMLM